MVLYYKKGRQTLHDEFLYIWSNIIEDDFLVRSKIKWNRKENGRIWLSLKSKQCLEDDDKLTWKIRTEIYLISMICVDDGVKPCAYIT
jgi:hypothetical protein